MLPLTKSPIQAGSFGFQILVCIKISWELVKTQIVGLHPWSFRFSTFRVWPRMSISNKFPGNTDAGGLRTIRFGLPQHKKPWWGISEWKNQAITTWIYSLVGITKVRQPYIVEIIRLLQHVSGIWQREGKKEEKGRKGEREGERKEGRKESVLN